MGRRANDRSTRTPAFWWTDMPVIFRKRACWAQFRAYGFACHPISTPYDPPAFGGVHAMTARRNQTFPTCVLGPSASKASALRLLCGHSAASQQQTSSVPQYGRVGRGIGRYSNAPASIPPKCRRARIVPRVGASWHGRLQSCLLRTGLVPRLSLSSPRRIGVPVASHDAAVGQHLVDNLCEAVAFDLRAHSRRILVGTRKF